MHFAFPNFAPLHSAKLRIVAYVGRYFSYISQQSSLELAEKEARIIGKYLANYNLECFEIRSSESTKDISLSTQKDEIFNPETKSKEKDIKISLGYKVGNLNSGKYFSYLSKQRMPEAVRKEAENLSDKLLANFNIEKYKVRTIRHIPEQPS